MMNQINPYDHCEIHAPLKIENEHQFILQLCYQPIIGIEATSLYLKLWVETEQSQTATCYHSYLLDALNFKPKQLLEARIVLEAIGLLKTYEKLTESHKSFKYILNPPLIGEDFFNDSILSVALLRKIGKQPFENLRKTLIQKPVVLDGYKDVTRSFTDVFLAITEDELMSVIDGNVITAENNKKIAYPFEYDLFDFKTFMLGMGQHLIPSRLFTLDIKIAMAKVAFVYNFSVTDMQRIVLLAWDTDEKLTKEAIESRAEEFYQLNVGGAMPKLVKKHEIFNVEKPSGQVIHLQEENEKKEELINYLNKTSPLEVFKLFNDYLPSESIVMQFNDFLRKGVSYGTLNVLIHYISMNEELSYNKNFMKVVLDNWLKKGATDARNTMEIAKKAHSYRSRKAKNLAKITVTKEDLTPVDNVELLSTELVDYKSSTPYQYLQWLNNGEEPFSGHVTLAESLFTSYQIPIEVANVIIRHVWETTSGNLPESFVESLASEIRFQQLTTAEQALDYIASRSERNLIKVTEKYLTIDADSIHYDKLIPYEFLKKLYDGQKPVQYAVDIAEELVLEQGLAVGPVNVLMEHAYTLSTGNFNKKFVQAIASNWMLEPPKNAQQAIRLIEQHEEQQKGSKITIDTPLAFKATLKEVMNWNAAYDEVLPINFMTKLLNGKTPVSSLIRDVDDLVLKHGIKVGVANAILEYKLSTDSKSFSFTDVAKIATELQRQNIELANDAIAYIKENYIKKQTYEYLTNEQIATYFNEAYVKTPQYEKYEKQAPIEFMKTFTDKLNSLQSALQEAEKYIKNRLLNPAVVNFLLEYTWQETNGKMWPKFVKTVADSWIEMQVQTIYQAQKAIDQHKKAYNPRHQKPVIEAPEWFEKEKERLINDTSVQSTNLALTEEEIVERKRRLLERMKGQ